MDRNEPKSSEPIQIPEKDVFNSNITIAKPAYLLTEDKFNILKKWQTTCTSLGLICAGYFLSEFFRILGVLISFYLNYSSVNKSNNTLDNCKIERWELISILVSLVAAIIFFFCDKFIKNQRSALNKEIENFYKKHR